VDIRRSKVIGILAQPAQALTLLCQHQDDNWDGPAELSDPTERPACQDEATATDEAAHRSLQISPPPFHPDRARPRAVISVHLSDKALNTSRGGGRVEDAGPVLLNRLHAPLGDHCSINLKPVIDLPAGHVPVDSYEIPARLREQLQLRNPADVFPHARRSDPAHRSRPHHSLSQPGPGRPAWPDQDREPRTLRPPPPQLQDLRWLASPPLKLATRPS
jgi:hypothetical protein